MPSKLPWETEAFWRGVWEHTLQVAFVVFIVGGVIVPALYSWLHFTWGLV